MVIPKVPVIACLYVNPATYTRLELLAVIFWLDIGVYGLTRHRCEVGIEFFKAMLTISWRDINSASLRAPSEISGRVVVQAVFTKPILTKRLFARCELSLTKTLSDSSELFSISVLATATTATVFATPFERKVSKNLFTFSSKELSVMVYLFSTK